MKLKFACLFLAAAVCTASAQGQVFQIGLEGFDADTNNWPGGEAPLNAINGVGQKYLNFGKENTGVAVTPSGGGIPTSITVWAANDAEERDPASFALYGTNHPAMGDPGDLIGDLVFLAGGDLLLPVDRTLGGDEPLGDFSSTMDFDSADAYETYVVVFPTLKDSVAANSMQIADIQLHEATGAGIFTPNDMIVGGQFVIPEPSTVILAGLGFVAVVCRLRRRD